MRQQKINGWFKFLGNFQTGDRKTVDQALLAKACFHNYIFYFPSTEMGEESHYLCCVFSRRILVENVPDYYSGVVRTYGRLRIVCVSVVLFPTV